MSKRSRGSGRQSDEIPRDAPPPSGILPMTAREAHRRLMEADHLRRVAEFEARGAVWARQADAWFEEWATGGKERADREAKEATEARRLEKEAEEAEKSRLKRERAKMLRTWRPIRKEAERLRIEYDTLEARCRLGRSSAWREQVDHDKAHARYLACFLFGRDPSVYLAELKRAMAALLDPEYGTGAKRVIHEQVFSDPTPPPPPRVVMVPGLDPFRVLGLTQPTTAEEVKSAYRRLAMTAHPDRGGTDEQFRELCSAYQAATALV